MDENGGDPYSNDRRGARLFGFSPAVRQGTNTLFDSSRSVGSSRRGQSERGVGSEAVEEGEEEEDDDMEDVDEDDDESSEQDASGSVMQPESELNFGGNLHVNASRVSCVRMSGYNAKHFGEGVVPRPLIPRGGETRQWIPYDSKYYCNETTGEVAPMRAKRSLCFQIPACMIVKGADKPTDFVTPSNASERARTEAFAQVFGLFNVATERGETNGRHSRLDEIAHERDEKIAKMKAETTWGEYLYRPDKDRHPDVVIPMYNLGAEQVYNEDGTIVVAYRYWKFIFDEEHSDSQAWLSLINNNRAVKNHGKVNGMAPWKRKAYLERANKDARMQTSMENVDDMGDSLWQRIDSTEALSSCYKAISGHTESDYGAESFDFFELPPLAKSTDLSVHSKLGGLHPLGPEYVLNAMRRPPPDSLHPTPCPLTFGLVDLKGKKINIHPDQAHPDKYFTEDGEFVPSDFVQRKQALSIFRVPYHKSFFTAPMAFSTQGVDVPGDNLCKLFFENEKTRDRSLVRSIELAREDPMVDADNWETHRSVIYTSLQTEMTQHEGLAQQVCDELRALSMAGKDSIGLTEEERESLQDMRLYHSAMESSEDGAERSLEPFQILKEISEATNNLTSYVSRWRNNKDAENAALREADKQAGLPNEAQHRANELEAEKRHYLCRRECAELALVKMRSAFESKKMRKTIAAGWCAIWDSFHSEVALCGTPRGTSQLKQHGGHIVDPMHPNATMGSAAVGLVYGQAYSDFDLSAVGQYHAHIMSLLNEDQGMKGYGTHITMAAHVQQFQVFQKKSFIMGVCGEQSVGKSKRCEDMQAVQLNGWWCKGGSSSEQAGKNGMDKQCGRVVYLDEITKDFSGDDDRTEYIKEITMSNSVTRQRTVEYKKRDGTKGWKTEISFTLHFETWVIATNCGVLLMKGGGEPSDNRYPMCDRMHVYVATPVSNAEATNTSGTQSGGDSVRMQRLNDRKRIYRIISGLTGISMMLIKHMNALQPTNEQWAVNIMSELDEMLVREVPNTALPTPRRNDLRMMTLLQKCVERTTVEKFYIAEGCVDYPDISPQSEVAAQEHHIPPWDILQLTDVVASLWYTWEDVLGAWSCGLEYNSTTSAVTWHVMTMVAMAHGVHLGDRHAVETDLPLHNPQGTAPIPAMQRPPDAVMYPEGGDVIRAEDSQEARVYQSAMVRKTQASEAMRGASNLTKAMVEQRQETFRKRRLLYMHAQARRKAINVNPSMDSNGPLMSLTRLLTTATLANGEGRCKIANSGIDMSAEEAAGCIMPTLNDVLNCGSSFDVMRQWINGQFDQLSASRVPSGFKKYERKLGAGTDGQWSFKFDVESEKATAADIDVSLRYIENANAAKEDSKPYKDAARNIVHSSSADNKVSQYAKSIGYSGSIIADALFMISKERGVLVGQGSANVFTDTGVSMQADDIPSVRAAGRNPAFAMLKEPTEGGGPWVRGEALGVMSAEEQPPALRPYGAEQWSTERSDNGHRAARVVAPRRADGGDEADLTWTRRMDALFMFGGIPAANPLALGKVDLGSPLKMIRNTLHVYSTTIVRHMSFFMEISYNLASTPECCDRFGMDPSTYPENLRRVSNDVFKPVVCVRADAAPTTSQGASSSSDNAPAAAAASTDSAASATDAAPAAAAAAVEEGGAMRRSIGDQPLQETQVEGFNVDARGNDSIDDAARAHNSQSPPLSPDPNAQPTPGISGQPVAGGDNSEISYLGFGYEMLGIYLTKHAIGMFSNDCDEFVSMIVEENSDVFTDLESVMNNLPHVSTRFCQMSEELKEEDKTALRGTTDVHHVPLTFEIKRMSTFRHNLITQSDIPASVLHREMQKADAYYGREVGMHSEEFRQTINMLHSRRRGIPGVQGNLFSRSVMVKAGLVDMFRNGQAYSQAECPVVQRAQDTGLNLRMRVYALRAKKMETPQDKFVAGVLGPRNEAHNKKRIFTSVQERERRIRACTATMHHVQKVEKAVLQNNEQKLTDLCTRKEGVQAMSSWILSMCNKDSPVGNETEEGSAADRAEGMDFELPPN